MKISIWWATSGLYRPSFPRLFPLKPHRLSFSLSRGALHPTDAPLWSWSGPSVLSCGKERSCGLWEVGGCVREDVGAAWKSRCIPWGSVQGLLGTDTPVSIQTNAALLWGSFPTLLHLPWCSVHLARQELGGGAAAAACFWCKDSTQKTVCGALLFCCEELSGYCSHILVQTHWVGSKQGYFSGSVSLFAPSLLQSLPSVLNAYLKKSLAQPVFVVSTSHVLRWRLSKNSTKPEFC